VQDIVTHNGHPYFIAVLREQADPNDAVSLATQAQAVFVLTMICDGYPTGQTCCLEAGLLQLLLKHMEEQTEIIASFMQPDGSANVMNEGVADHLLLLKWTLLALGKLFDNQPSIVHMAHEQGDAIKKLKVRIRSLHMHKTAVFLAMLVHSTGAHVCSLLHSVALAACLTDDTWSCHNDLM
jgi:hypothetical protein